MSSISNVITDYQYVPLQRSATAMLVKKITDTVLETGIRVNTVSAIMLPEGNEG